MAKRSVHAFIIVLAWLVHAHAAAVDLRLSGFGTVGFAWSDQQEPYLRHVDDSGTFKADSLLGVQAEVQFDRHWSATFQGVASASRVSDSGNEAKIRWAFVGYRPTNDWLFRLGRLRLPFFVHTQNSEVGVTYDQARLPIEMYYVSPIYDFDGAAVAKTFELGTAEVQVEAFWGKSNIGVRLFTRDTGEVVYVPGRVTARGLVVSHVSPGLVLRGSVVHASLDYGNVAPVETFEATNPFAPIPPPLGGPLYLPGRQIASPTTDVAAFGADWTVAAWRMTAELSWRNVPNVKDTGSSLGGYVTLARSIGHWTPYVTYARLLSGSGARSLSDELNSTPVPLIAQGAPFSFPASFHRILADQGIVFDQYSMMLGVAYSFTPTSKVKAEWMRTHVGLRSSLVDGDVREKSFNVFSLSYSFAF